MLHMTVIAYFSCKICQEVELCVSCYNMYTLNVTITFMELTLKFAR